MFLVPSMIVDSKRFERMSFHALTDARWMHASAPRIASTSVAGSLKALDQAVKGSLFDTEPLQFERVLREASGPAQATVKIGKDGAR